MPGNPNASSLDALTAERIARLEARLERIEAHIGLPAMVARAPEIAPRQKTAPVPAALATGQAEDELEFEVGQNWFAIAGILALAVGGAFMLSLPYATLPAAGPSLIGLVVAAALYGLAHVWRQSFELVARYLRGAGMALMYFATLRLFFFGAEHVLTTDSGVGRTVLLLVVALAFAIALRRHSPWLMTLALITGYATALAVGTAWFVLVLIAVLSCAVVIVSLRRNWPSLVLVGMVLSSVTYSLWAVGSPFRGGAFHFVSEPSAAPGFLLFCTIVFALAPLFRRATDAQGDSDVPSILGTVLNCIFGYGPFLVHTAAVFPTWFAAGNGLASVLLLSLAALFWVREHSQWSTFFYAMTGYAALSMAIIKFSVVPVVFVWLSVQSIVVVATAISFRSRFIVVANFLIFVAIVLAYVVLSERETGVSLGFGIVALVSARILNWQQHRLELKTELMRNAYLLCAFAVFPYALAHLVSTRHVALTWVGLAVTYYLLNLIVRNQKYRWMGHATLLLASIYVVTVGTRQFEPVYRIASFLVLGTVLLIVSLSFTRIKRRASGTSGAAK